MATPVVSSAGAGGSASDDEADRLGRRDLLVLRLELLRRRRSGPPASGQRATRSTR